MPLTLTPGMEQLVAAVDALAAGDPFTLADGVLLSAGEALVTQRDRPDFISGRNLNAIWSKESTVTEYGQSVKGWLVGSICRRRTRTPGSPPPASR